MARLHHQLDGHESEQTPGDGEGQRSLARCSPRGRKELATTQGLSSTYGLSFEPGESTQSLMAQGPLL